MSSTSLSLETALICPKTVSESLKFESQQVQLDGRDNNASSYLILDRYLSRSVAGSLFQVVSTSIVTKKTSSPCMNKINALSEFSCPRGL